jgi:proteic killer suppression protein
MDVILSKKAQKDITKIPLQVQSKLFWWIKSVMKFGIQQVRLSKGLHDEPLVGKRRGQRSIRLNRAYRAIYIVKLNGQVEFVEIIEVNKHDY